MTDKNHCWSCKSEFDGSEETCDRCGSGRICPDCGVCLCDHHGTGAGGATKVDVKDLFQKLVDEAEEIEIAAEFDTEPVERELLAGAMQESGMVGAAAPVIVITDLEPALLQSKKLRAIAEAVLPLVKVNAPLNIAAVSKMFRDEQTRALVRELMGITYDTAIFPLYIKQIRDAAQAREVLKVLAPVAKKLLGADTLDPNTLSELILGARSGLVVPMQRGIEVVSERDELLDYYQRLEELQIESEFTGYNTGFRRLNLVINGLCVGLIVIAGFPGAGKTTLFKQLHYQVAILNGIPVIFISYEQSKGELRVKDLSRLSMVNNRDIIRGRHDKQMENWEKVQNAAAQIYASSGHQFVVEADQRWDVAHIRAYVESVMARCGTDKAVVFIDYLQRVPAGISSNASSRRDEVSLVCSDMTRMARDLSVPVIAISSESRASYNKKGLDVFKESGEVEYSADVAGVLHVDKKRSAAHAEKYKKTHERRRAVDLYVVKNRNGEHAKITFDFYPQFGLFKELDSEAYEFHEGLPDGGAK